MIRMLCDFASEKEVVMRIDDYSGNYIEAIDSVARCRCTHLRVRFGAEGNKPNELEDLIIKEVIIGSPGIIVCLPPKNSKFVEWENTSKNWTALYCSAVFKKK